MPGIAEIPKEIQKLKVKNQNGKAKFNVFNLCSVILHFYLCILMYF